MNAPDNFKQADVDAIHSVAMDYIDGYFKGQPERMRRALHPELRKCYTYHDPVSGKVVMGHDRGAETLVRHTAEGLMKEDGVEVTAEVLYVFRDIAIARTRCPYFEDLLHLANFGGYGWRIVNAIWQMNEGEYLPDIEFEMEYWAGIGKAPTTSGSGAT